MLRARLAMLTLTGTLLATSGCATTCDRPLLDRILHPFAQRPSEEGTIVSVSPPIEGPVLGEAPVFVAPPPTRQNGSGLIRDNNVPPLATPPNGRLEPKAQPIPYAP